MRARFGQPSLTPAAGADRVDGLANVPPSPPCRGPAFHGLIRTAPEKRDIPNAIAQVDHQSRDLRPSCSTRICPTATSLQADAFSVADIAVWLRCRPLAQPADHNEREAPFNVGSAGTLDALQALPCPPRRCWLRRSREGIALHSLRRTGRSLAPDFSPGSPPTPARAYATSRRRVSGSARDRIEGGCEGRKAVSLIAACAPA